MTPGSVRLPVGDHSEELSTRDSLPDLNGCGPDADPETDSVAPLLAASAAARRGGHVFPCHTPTGNRGCSCRRDCGKSAGKHPRTANGLAAATTDESTIRRWWHQWPEANPRPTNRSAERGRRARHRSRRIRSVRGALCPEWRPVLVPGDLDRANRSPRRSCLLPAPRSFGSYSHHRWSRGARYRCSSRWRLRHPATGASCDRPAVRMARWLFARTG